MPQRDLYHDPIKHALIKGGWTITDDPFRIIFQGDILFADLGAEKPIAAKYEARQVGDSLADDEVEAQSTEVEIIDDGVETYEVD